MPRNHSAQKSSEDGLTVLLYRLPKEVAAALAEALAHVAPEWRLVTEESVSISVVLHHEAVSLPEQLSRNYIITLGQGDAFTQDEASKKIDKNQHYHLSQPFHLVQLQQTLAAIAVEKGQCGLGSLADFRLLLREKLLIRDRHTTGQRVALTDQEMSLISYLLARGDTGTRRELLLSEVWGYAEEAETQTIETHISKLRQKLTHVDLELLYDDGEYRLRAY